MKDQSIERESETAEDRKSFPKRLVAEQPGRYPIVRIEERSIGIPSRAIANSAESVAAGTQKRGKHRLDATAQPQIGVADNTGGDLGLAAVSAGAYRRHPVHEFGFADRAHLDRTRVPVHRVRLHKYRCDNVVASTGIGQEVVQRGEHARIGDRHDQLVVVAAEREVKAIWLPEAGRKYLTTRDRPDVQRVFPNHVTLGFDSRLAAGATLAERAHPHAMSVARVALARLGRYGVVQSLITLADAVA